MSFSLHEIAQKVEGTVLGDGAIHISTLASIEDITDGALIFADSEANLRRAEESNAAAILVNQHLSSNVKPLIQVANPFQSFIHLLNLFYPAHKPAPGIHPTAIIAEDVVLGDDVFIGPYVIIESGSHIGAQCIIKGHVTIGRHVHIGNASIIHPHVSIYDHTHIGSRVSIHASSVIGCDGFGYTFIEGQHVKVPHVGHVIIEDDVEIGANTVIDRATIGITKIGEGTKIDNLVQIAHSVKLGKHNILCAFTGIAGSSISGDHVIFAANVGVSDHVRIDDGVILAARAGVPPKKHLKKGNVYLGNPARPRDKAIEQELSVTRIPLMSKNLKRLNEKVNELSKRFVNDTMDKE